MFLFVRNISRYRVNAEELKSKLELPWDKHDAQIQDLKSIGVISNQSLLIVCERGLVFYLLHNNNNWLSCQALIETSISTFFWLLFSLS